MTTSNSVFGNISRIYIVTAQSPIFSLLRVYHFATAHLPIINLVQIDQIFRHWESSKYLITLHRKIVWQLLIAYLEIIQRFIFLLRKAQFFRYCASYIHFVTAHLSNICLLQIDKLFQHWKSFTYSVTVRRRIVGQLLIAYLETFRRFIWLLRKAQFLGYCASIILLLRISHLFMYCKSTNYFTTGNCLHNCLLCIEKFCGYLKLPIWKHIKNLYGYYAKHNFLATALQSFC
jgi:hypothetical protein